MSTTPRDPGSLAQLALDWEPFFWVGSVPGDGCASHFVAAFGGHA